MENFPHSTLCLSSKYNVNLDYVSLLYKGYYVGDNTFFLTHHNTATHYLCLIVLVIMYKNTCFLPSESLIKQYKLMTCRKGTACRSVGSQQISAICFWDNCYFPRRHTSLPHIMSHRGCMSSMYDCLNNSYKYSSTRNAFRGLLPHLRTHSVRGGSAAGWLAAAIHIRYSSISKSINTAVWKYSQ